MKDSRTTYSASALSRARSRTPEEPVFQSLTQMPETPEELFRALGLTVKASVSQPDPAGKKPPTKQEYALPWKGFRSWHDARARLKHFEKTFKGQVVWIPFNNNTSNDGPMSLSAFPGRAFIERVTNEGDAVLEAKALFHKPPMPESPAEAAALWYELDRDALATRDDAELRSLAQQTVTVTGFVGDPEDHRDAIIDARDYGVGLSAAEMPTTILSLNRGNKKSKHWLTGKHGQGASSTYQYSDLSLIASRKAGAKNVAFTLVEKDWDVENGVAAKTPTYKYLTIGGQVPEIAVPEQEFPVGTLVRHIGYDAANLLSLAGEHSIYGLLMRSLAKPLFPVWLEIVSLRPGTALGYPTFPGFRRYGRLIRGTVNVLERAWAKTLKTRPAEAGNEDGDGTPQDGGDAEADGTNQRLLHRASEYYKLPTWDYGARTGVGELGRVKYSYWVADSAGRSSDNVLRSWVDPNKTILMTLHGQTHAEESRAIITGRTGANLWAVGRYMVVQIDCDALDPRAQYELFTSTREHAKETPIKEMILGELVRRLALDQKLQELNTRLAAADVKPKDGNPESIAALIKKYLRAAGISFEQLTRKIEKWRIVDTEKEVPASKRELPPIEAVEPPTFVRWRFAGETVKMYPGQRYSFVFETDAQPSYWDPADPARSKIRVFAQGVDYVGAGEMKGGRVRCHFECPATAVVGTKGLIQVQLDFAVGAAKTSSLQVDIVEKPAPKPARPPRPDDGKEPDEEGDSKKIIKVKIRKKDFTEAEIPIVTPVPVKRDDPPGLWGTLGWPLDPQGVGFSIRSLEGKIRLYYNAEFPPLLDLKHRMSKKSLEDEFVRRYQLKLILHTIFTLNYDFVDEEDFGPEQRKQVRNLLCATAESLALATKTELEIESHLKSEDNAPLETVVAANLKETAGLAQVDGAAGEAVGGANI